VCSGGTTELVANSSCTDCADIPNGNNNLDNCDVCDIVSRIVLEIGVEVPSMMIVILRCVQVVRLN